jgi:hypothetical protein
MSSKQSGSNTGYSGSSYSYTSSGNNDKVGIRRPFSTLPHRYLTPRETTTALVTTEMIQTLITTLIREWLHHTLHPLDWLIYFTQGWQLLLQQPRRVYIP